MKGKKRIGILALSLAFVGVATSCGSYAVSRNTSPVKDEDAIVIEDTDRTELKSIVLDTSNVRKVFYIGEEFSYEGLVVNRSLSVYDANGKNKGLVDMPTKDFTVDYSEVDMNTVGTYKITVKHRLSNKILTQSYNVSVKPSVFESTPGLTFNAGLEVSFEDGKKIKDYLLHDTYVEKYKDDYDHNFNLYSLLNGLSIKLHKWTSNGDTATESRVLSLTPDQVTIDSSSVDIDTVGTYIVKVTYEADDIVIDGVNYNNDASAFLIIDVQDPIESIKISSGSALFTQSIYGIDVEAAGWEVYVQPVVSDSYTEPFSYDKYQIDGVDIFKVNQAQDVTVSLIEDPSVKCTKGIRINQSTTQNIISYASLETNVIFDDPSDPDKPTDVLLAGTDFIHGPLPLQDGNTKYDSYYPKGATYAKDRADVYGSITFDTRITMKGTDQAIKIELDKKCELVLFFNTTSEGDERDLNVYPTDPITNKISDEYIWSTTSNAIREITVGSSKKPEIDRAIVSIEEPGTYYIANPSGGIWFYGLIIITDK